MFVVALVWCNISRLGLISESSTGSGKTLLNTSDQKIEYRSVEMRHYMQIYSIYCIVHQVESEASPFHGRPWQQNERSTHFLGRWWSYFCIFCIVLPPISGYILGSPLNGTCVENLQCWRNPTGMRPGSPQQICSVLRSSSCIPRSPLKSKAPHHLVMTEAWLPCLAAVSNVTDGLTGLSKLWYESECVHGCFSCVWLCCPVMICPGWTQPLAQWPLEIGTSPTWPFRE